MKKLVLALALIPSLAWGADALPTKAPINPLFSGYPYTSQGWYFGLNTIGGGGSVSASAPTIGVNPNSVISNQIAVGGTVGYVWARGNVFYAVEGMFDVNNFNGSAPGFSMKGPAAFEQRVKIGTPLNNFLNLFPTLGLPTVPPFPSLPGGAVATNVHPYLMAGLHEDDISINFGLANNKAWSVAPSIGVGAMGQLTNGVAVDVWAETVFTDSAVCISVIGCQKQGQKYLVGLGIYY